MKQWRISDWILLLCSGLALAAFFLPWVKLETGFNPLLKSLAESLQKETDPGIGWRDFIFLSEMQWSSAIQKPFYGKTGSHLFADIRRNDSSGVGSRYFVGQFLGQNTYPEQAYFVAGLPLALAVMGLLGLLFLRNPRTLAIMGGVLLAVYLFLRWRIAYTEGARLALDIRVGLGLWLLVYCILVTGLLLLLRAAFPKGAF